MIFVIQFGFVTCQITILPRVLGYADVRAAMTVTTFHTVLPAPQQPRSKEEKQSLYTNTSVQMDLRPRLYFLMSSDSDETMKGCLKYVFLPYGWIFVFAVT